MSLKAALLRELGDIFLRQEWSEYQGKQAKKATHDRDGGVGDLNPPNGHGGLAALSKPMLVGGFKHGFYFP